MGEEQLVGHLIQKNGLIACIILKNENEFEMKSEIMKEMCPDQGSDIEQQLLPDRLTGRARDFGSRSAGPDELF